MLSKRNDRLLALIIKGLPQGESNRLVTVFLADGRMINGIAHGARKPASKFGASLEPGTVTRIGLRYGSQQDSLVTVTDGLIVNSHSTLKSNLAGMGILFDFLGLLQYVCRGAGGDILLFRRSVALLDHAETNPNELSGLMPMARAAALTHLGGMPDWTCCSRCRIGLPDRVSLHGVLCNSCAAIAGEKTRPVSRQVTGLAHRIVQGSIPLGNEPWGELDGILDWMLHASGIFPEGN
jgi:DNA repair protein RecO (recombination protein O)